MAGSEQRIQTTVVGSYPVPDWLGTAPSEDRIIDATRVILHTQEILGIDVVCDGEVYRYDFGHPETNGMIEYFLRPMAGIRNSFTFDELVRFETDQMDWRKEPAGVAEGLVDGGLLNLPAACRRARALTGNAGHEFRIVGLEPAPGCSLRRLLSHLARHDRIGFPGAELAGHGKIEDDG